ncbi:MAG: PASTA domain-containing protein [Candidatus Hydrogenedentes bacterium]|nr:PASTA domain-containing protein [Candidatus Hydrogenedentota bacterium]
MGNRFWGNRGFVVMTACAVGTILAHAVALIVVPDVVGKNLDRAENMLIANGLYLTRISFEMYDGTPNRVLEQKPKAGKSVEPGTGVALVVSRPPRGNCENIKVFEPKVDRKWKVGSTHRILWTVGDDCCDEVSITLWEDGELVRTIVSSTQNDGEYEWNIPRRFDPGTYRIRVACDAMHDGFSNEFRLKGRR